MPRKKPEPVAPAAVPVTPAPASIPIDDAPAAWSSILADMGPDADVTIDVYAEPDKGQGGAEWVCSVNAADFPQLSDLLAYVKAHPDGGPGRYSLRMKQGGKFRGAPRVSIAGRRPPPLPPGVAPAQPSTPAVDVLGEIRAMQQRADERYMSLLEKLIPSRGDGANGFDSVIKAAQLLVPPPASRTPIGELKDLLSLAELLRGKRDEAAAGDDAGGDGDNWLTTAIKTFGPPLVAAATTPAAPPQLAPRPMPIAPPPQNAPPQAAPPTGAPAPQLAPRPVPAAPAPGSNPLAPLLGLLLRGATSSGDPAAYASVALDLLGDYAPVLLERADALDQLMAMAPAAVPHREWFAELLEAAREMLAESPEESPQGGGLTGAETGPDGPAHVADESAAVP